MNDRIAKKQAPSSAINLYTINDYEQEKNVETISPGQVIMATNLAGRGTDIWTDKIEPNGGLRVILTFLLRNERVEDQAFGRTARQGKRGSGIMILNTNSPIGYGENAKNSQQNMKDKRKQIDSANRIQRQ